MNVICPKCLDINATVRISLDDGDTLTCGGCAEEYSAARVREMVASWAKVLPWIEAHPARKSVELGADRRN